MPIPLRVLILGDRPSDAELMSRELRRAGYEPTAQRVDTEAAYLAGLETPPDLILADFSLPQFDALRALDRLRDRGLDVPFIIVSDRIGEETAVLSMKRGAADCLLKDRLARLGPAVERALEQKRLRSEKERAESALRAGERRLRALIETSTDVIALLDAQANLLYISHAVQRVYGCTADEALGRPPFEFIHPDDRPEAEARLADAQRTPGTIVTAEFRARHHNGEWRWTEAKAHNLLDDPSVSAVVVNFRDITERKRAEAALRESETRLRQMAESIREVFWLLDPRTPAMLYVGPAFETVWGRSPQSLYEDPGSFYASIHPDDYERVIRAGQAQARGHATTDEYRVVRPDGGIRWVRDRAFPIRDETGQVYRVAGIAEDVTERKWRERELEAIAAVSAALRAANGRAQMAPIILEQVMGLLDTGAAALALLDPATGELVVELGRGELAGLAGLRLPPSGGIGGHVVATGQPCVTNDAGADPQFHQFPWSDQARAAACVPLSTQQQPFGVLWAGRAVPFAEEEVHVLSAIANMAGNAIQRAMLHEQTVRRAEELAAINSLGRALAETLDLPTVYARLYRTTEQLLPDIAALFISLFDPVRERITCAYGIQDGQPVDVSGLPPIPLAPPGSGSQSTVIRSRQPLIVNDLPQRLADSAVSVLVGATERLTQSALYVPMLAKGQAIGLVQVQSYTPRRFGPADVELLALVANTAAIAIENARLFEMTRQRLEQLQALHAIDLAITASLDVNVTLNVVLDQVATQLRVDAADVLLLDPHLNVLGYAAGRGFRTGGIARSRLRLGEGHAGRVALERCVVLVSDRTAPEHTPARAALLANEGFIFYCGVPLVCKGQIKGVLEVFHRTPLAPNPDWLDFLETLAGQAAVAIDNSTLFEDLQRSNVELAMAYDTTLEGWSRALDLRDKETEGHTQRVTGLAVRLAQAMGMSEAELTHLRRGALLHDIGKMGIPDHILLKPAPLTDDEWAVMRRHPAYAFEMLAPIAYLRPALDIPCCHHERWDGTGYPRGLRGEAIPPAARVFAVADVWDALRSDRPYRKAWAEADVREYVRAQSGKRFDPDVVEAFLTLLSTMPADGDS